MNHSPKRHHNGIMIAINSSTRAAIDLASIMVGILVIAIIGGVIAATVFAVIPWAQDNAAKQAIDAVSTAESAYRGFEADKAEDSGQYADKETLVTYVPPKGKPGLVEDADTYLVRVAVDPDGKPCWAAVSKSQTGNYFYGTNKTTAKDPAVSMSAVNTVLADICPVDFPDFPDGDGPPEVLPPGVTEGEYVTATSFDNWNPYLQLLAPVSSVETEFPWAVGKDNGTAALPTEIEVYINDTPIPLNSSADSYWEVIYNTTTIDLWLHENDVAEDVDAAGFTFDEFLADGWVITTLDGVENNVIKLNIGDDDDGPGDNENPDGPDPVYETISYNNWTQNNNLAANLEYGFYDQTNTFKASDNGQYLYVQQNWFSQRARAASEDGGTTWHWTYGCYEGAYADNGDKITAAMDHTGSIGGIDQTNRAILKNNCGYDTLGMSDVIPADTFLPDPYYSNQSYTHMGTNVEEVLTSQSTIVGLLRTIDYSAVDGNGYQTYPTTYNVVISNDNGASGSLVELPAGLNDAFTKGTGRIFLDGTTLTLFNGENQTFNLYDVSGGGLSLIHTENIQGQVSSTVDGYYDFDADPITYTEFTVYNFDEVSVSVSENGQHVVLGGGSGHLGVSHNGGSSFTWSVPGNDEQETIHVSSSAISNNGDRIIAKVHSLGVYDMYISNNGGTTWESAGAPSVHMDGTVFRSDANLNVVRYFIPSRSNQQPTMSEWVWGDVATYEQCVENCDGGGGGPTAS